MKSYLFILAILFLSACGGVSSGERVSGGDGKITDLVRMVDREAGVVCYRYAYNGATLDCLPISETRLKTDK